CATPEPLKLARCGGLLSVLREDNSRLLAAANLGLTRKLPPEEVKGAASITQFRGEPQHVHHESSIEFSPSDVLVDLVKWEKPQMPQAVERFFSQLKLFIRQRV